MFKLVRGICQNAISTSETSSFKNTLTLPHVFGPTPYEASKMPKRPPQRGLNEFVYKDCGEK